MMRVVRRPRFLSDLSREYDYLQQRNPRAAEGLPIEVERVVSSLQQFPESGRERPELGAGLRYFRVRRYRHLIFYRVLPGRLLLLRLVHSARKIGPSTVAGS